MKSDAAFPPLAKGGVDPAKANAGRPEGGVDPAKANAGPVDGDGMDPAKANAGPADGGGWTRRKQMLAVQRGGLTRKDFLNRRQRR